METPEKDFEMECDTNYLPTKIAQDLKETPELIGEPPIFA
jgi:hypothetical protein